MVDRCNLELIKNFKKHASDVLKEFEEFKQRYAVSESDDMAVKLGEILQEKTRKIEMRKLQRVLAVKKGIQVRSSVYKGLGKDDALSKKISEKIESLKKKGPVTAAERTKIRQDIQDPVIRKNFRQTMQNGLDRTNAIIDEGANFLADAARVPGMKKMMRDDDFQKNVYRAIIDPDTYKFPDGSPVKIMADAIKKQNDWMHIRKTQAGFELGYVQGYVGKQLHNYDKITKAGNDAWVTTLKRDLDWDKMGFEADQIDDYLARTYSKITGPQKMIDNQYVELVRGTTKGVEAPRSFLFKDSDAAFNYQKQFGADNMFDQMQKTLRVDSQKVAMAELFSPRHQAVFEKTINDVSVNMDKVAFGKLDREMRSAYDFLTGKSSHGAPQTLLGKSATAARQLTDMSKLSLKSVMTTITDPAYGAGRLNAVLGGGVNGFGQKWAKLNIDTVKLGTSPKMRQDLAKRIGIFNAEANLLMGSKFAREGTETGQSWRYLDKMHEMFMGATGLPLQSQAARLASSKQMAMGLADSAHLSFDKLYSGTQKALDELNISAKEWDVIRTQGLDEFEGINMLTPSQLRGKDGEQNLELAGKFASFFRQEAEIASPTGSLRSSAYKNKFSPDSKEGIMIRFVMQYKSFPIAAMRTITKIGQAGNPYGNMAMTIATSTALGAGVIQMRQFLKDGEFKDPKDNSFWVSSFVQGGSGGLWGDFLTTDYSKRWRNLGSDVLGPAPSMLIEGAALGAETVRGKASAKDFGKFLHRNSPSFLNMPLVNKKILTLLKEL